MSTEIRKIITIIDLHPSQRIGYLAGSSYLVPSIGRIIFMVRESRVKSRCRIKSFLIIEQIPIFLD